MDEVIPLALDGPLPTVERPAAPAAWSRTPGEAASPTSEQRAASNDVDPARDGGGPPRRAPGPASPGRLRGPLERRQVEPAQRAPRHATWPGSRSSRGRPGRSTTTWSTAALFFVDLPGYGYATASQAERARAGASGSPRYLEQEPRLRLVVGLVDPRIPTSPLDVDLVALRARRRAGRCWSVLTKADKLGRAARSPRPRPAPAGASSGSTRRPLAFSRVTGAGKQGAARRHRRALAARERTTLTRSTDHGEEKAATRSRPRTPASGADPNPEGLPVVLEEETLEAEAAGDRGQAAARHARPQGHVDRRPHPGGHGPRGREPRRHAQAGPDLQDPAGADRARGADLRRGRARDPAGRLRLPARPRVQLPAGSRRHLRLAVADPPLQPAHRRHGVRPDPPAAGGRALLRADQGRGDQLRAARHVAGEDPLRQPDAAVPAGAHQPRARGQHDLRGS